MGKINSKQNYAQVGWFHMDLQLDHHILWLVASELGISKGNGDETDVDL